MTTYSDNLGNYFIGNVTVSSNDPISDTNQSNINTDLASVCGSSGLRTRNIANQSSFLGLNSINILHFGANADTTSIDDRILFATGLYSGSLSSSFSPKLYLFNDGGGTLLTTPNSSNNSANLTNQIFKRTVNGTLNNNNVLWNTGESLYWAGVSDGNSLALIQFTTKSVTSVGANLEFIFWYGGMLNSPDVSLNTNSSKYITLLANKMYAANGNIPLSLVNDRSRVFLDNETFNNTGANYSFSCVNGTIPTKQWVKDFEVKNGSTVMGKARNLLIGSGSYPLLIPLRIIGTGGLEKWLPVCHYFSPDSTNYTILMRCYSTS